MYELHNEPNIYEIVQNKKVGKKKEKDLEEEDEEAVMQYIRDKQVINWKEKAIGRDSKDFVRL